MLTIEGIWISLVTPFRQGKLDLHSAQQLALQLSGTQIQGLVVCGHTGEVATLNESEQEKMLCAVTEAVQNRCPVVMGVEGSNTRAVTEKIIRLNRLRPGGFIVSAPSGASQKGLYLHFLEIVNVAESPLILSGKQLDRHIVTALKQSSNRLIAIACNPNLARTIKLNQADLPILCGEDKLLFNMLSLGGQGVISTCAHIRPDLFVRLFKLLRAGLFEHARNLYQHLLPLIQILASEPNPGPVKAALALQGRLQDELRLPMTPMSVLGRTKLNNVLEKIMAIPVSRERKNAVVSRVRQDSRLCLVR